MPQRHIQTSRHTKALAAKRSLGWR